jgi:hypothetical protein
MRVTRVFVIDIIAAVLYIVAANPTITGLLVHEWISLGVFVTFVVHTAQHCDWIIDTFKKLRHHPSIATVGNLLLDSATVMVFMVVTVTGIMLSRHILPAFRLVASGYFFWNPLHSLSAKVLLALLIVHVVLHARWLWAFVKDFRQRKNHTLNERKDDGEV